jgi:Raf kinase inhibitor-like YbhB/YbcL family protein
MSHMSNTLCRILEVQFMNELTVKSSAFENNKLIPSKYTCDGADVNPPLTIGGIPEKTKSFVIIMEDPDAPAGLWIHWVVWNIPATGVIKENSVLGAQGLNTAKKHGYHGPCPPAGTHRYFFKVYALDTILNLGSLSEKEDVETAMQSHVLAQGELMGLYRRTR